MSGFMCNLQESLNINLGENRGNSQEMSPFFNSEKDIEKHHKSSKGRQFFILSSARWRIFFSLLPIDNDIKFSDLKDLSFIFSQLS